MCEACLDRCLGAYRNMYVLRYYRAECALRFMAKLHIVVLTVAKTETEHLHIKRSLTLSNYIIHIIAISRVWRELR